MIVEPFSLGVGSVTGPTNDRPTILQGIEAIRPAGGTAILDSLVQVAHSLMNAEGRRAIVLITDGYDERSKAQYDDALDAVRAAGATVYVVGIGGVAGISIKGERLLRHLAVETGGRFFFPSRDEQLTDVHDTLTDDVQNRYLITYTPKNQKTDGTWRGISVRTADAGYVVRARTGYFAPKPAPIRPRVEFTATDPGGRYLDLSKDELEVLEDGAPQSVETFQEAVQDVSIVLALDASGSMKKKEADVIASAQDFVGALQEKDQLALVMFGDKSIFAHDLSRNRDYSRNADRRVPRASAAPRSTTRCTTRCTHQERRGPPGGGGDDRRPRREQRRERARQRPQARRGAEAGQGHAARWSTRSAWAPIPIARAAADRGPVRRAGVLSRRRQGSAG